MKERLNRIYTRTGDRGTTGLGDGVRVEKDDPRIEAIGTVDELNSSIGLILACTLPEQIRDQLQAVQNDLFDLGGELTRPGLGTVTDAYVEHLEHVLDRHNAGLPPLKEFILPGGGPAAAACHLARTVCRRAERRVVSLRREQTVAEPVLKYLNRLSDLLFVLGRVLARAEEGEVLWQPGRTADKGGPG